MSENVCHDHLCPKCLAALRLRWVVVRNLLLEAELGRAGVSASGGLGPGALALRPSAAERSKIQIYCDLCSPALRSPFQKYDTEYHSTINI